MTSIRQSELIAQIGKVDTAISEARQRIDSAARGQRYKEVVVDAESLVKQAKLGLELKTELNKILEAEWAKNHGR